jgi:hypothetical protein
LRRSPNHLGDGALERWVVTNVEFDRVRRCVTTVEALCQFIGLVDLTIGDACFYVDGAVVRSYRVTSPNTTGAKCISTHCWIKPLCKRCSPGR